MLFKVDDPTPFDLQAETTLKTNFFATRNVCTELLPIIKPHGKSSVGLVSLRKQPQVPQTGPPIEITLSWGQRTALFSQSVWLLDGAFKLWLSPLGGTDHELNPPTRDGACPQRSVMSESPPLMLQGWGHPDLSSVMTFLLFLSSCVKFQKTYVKVFILDVVN